MVRPCFLVADREYSGTISTRKLVIETAKLNVITTYSGEETIATLKRFPNVDGVVLDSKLEDMPLESLIQELKRLQPEVPVIVVVTPGYPGSGSSDHELDSFDPIRLLKLLENL